MTEADTVTDSTEIWFYHLEQSSLEQVLPVLLEKSVARGWRSIVRASEASRLDALDQHLWTYRPDSFLAHGKEGDAHADKQPVWLTTRDENPNGAQVLFIVDEADLGQTTGFERRLVLFDGRDEAALARAREQWKKMKADGADVSYWRQNEEGAWSKAA